MNVVIHYEIRLQVHHHFNNPIECSCCEATICPPRTEVPAQGAPIFVEVYESLGKGRVKLCPRCLRALAAYVGTG